MVNNTALELKQHLSKLSARDQNFAQSLLDQLNRRGKLSSSQWDWVGKLAARATAPKPEQTKLAVGSMSGVIALFSKAQEKLKHPKIVLQLADGTPVILSVAGQGSKEPGSINVMGEGQYPTRPWFGRISPAGEWAPSRGAQNMMDELLGLLVEFAKAPAEIAKKYGLLTGNCCFCNKKLTDEKSVAAGFGPVCADNYGLKAEWKAAVDKKEIPEMGSPEHVEQVKSVFTPDAPVVPVQPVVAPTTIAPAVNGLLTLAVSSTVVMGMFLS